MNPLFSQYKTFVKNLLAALGLGVFSGGLEVTDHLIRLAHFDGDRWRLNAVRLDADVLEKGKIKDRERFVAALAALRATVPGMAGKSKKIDVTVALGESVVYNQVFSLPFVEGKGFADAVRLNMQMASPMDAAQTYSGWEISGRDLALGRVDVLGAFADRAMVDEMTEALFEAGFVSSAIESKALALARIFRVAGEGVDPHGSYLFVNVDDASLDFLVVRDGKLYFEYATPWHDLADPKGVVPMEKFEETLGANLRQVMNFSLQHWPGAIAGIVITGGVFVDETKRIAEQALGLPAFPLTLAADTSEIRQEWFVAMGASLRNAADEKGEGSAVTLLGEGSREMFGKAQVLRFAEFWHLLMPIMFAVLIGLFVAADLFLVGQKNEIAGKSVKALTDAENQQIIALWAASANFNQSVAFIASIESGQDPKYRIVQDIMQLAAADGVTVTRFSFTGYENQASLSGEAESQEQILAFQTAVGADDRFGPATLPLTGIQSSGGAYSFSMTFPAKKIAATSTAE